MKKVIMSFILSLCLFFIGNAQKASSFAKGDKLLNVGVGLNSYYQSGIPLGASLEVGISDLISVGGNVDYLGSKYDYGSGLSVKYRSLYIGARGSYHVNQALKITNAKVDLYVGATVGYRNFSFKDSYSGSSPGNAYGNGIFIGGYIGGKYYFNNNISAFTELGAIGSTNARIGLGFKL